MTATSASPSRSRWPTSTPTDWIRLAGHVSDDELLALYRQAWVVASASIAEGWGMTLTEAAACGTPAVATRINGHSDAVVDGRSGLLADGSRDLAAKLSQVLGDPDLRRPAERGRPGLTASSSPGRPPPSGC